MRSVLLLSLFISVLSVGMCSPACSGKRKPRLITFNPPELVDPKPDGYSHITVDSKTGVAHIAGQLAQDRTRAIVGKTLSEQFEKVAENLEIALKSVGADFKDVMRMNLYIVNYEAERDVEAIGPFMKRFGRPVATLISVPALAFEGPLLEIDIDAAVRKSVVKRLQCGV